MSGKDSIIREIELLPELYTDKVLKQERGQAVIFYKSKYLF